MAEGISGMGEEMLGVLKDAMHEENPHSIRLKAVDAATKIEEKEARMKMDEEEHLRELGHDALVEAVARKFTGNPMVFRIFQQAGQAKAELPASEDDEDEVVDAEVVG